MERCYKYLNMKFNKKEIENIAMQLRQGNVGVFPFDTIWGITGVIDEGVVERINKIKSRPKDQPLLIVISSMDSLVGCVKELQDWQVNMINDVWPGPISIVFQKSENIPGYVTGGKETIGIRLPVFEPLNYLLDCVGQPLVSTSANFSKQKEANQYKDIPGEIISAVDFVCNSFIPPLGEASRVIDCSVDKVKIIRP
jgi:L-threonylcarbamoyladenylate synthase